VAYAPPLATELQGVLDALGPAVDTVEATGDAIDRRRAGPR
jgi:hypothetical protein